MAFRSRPPTSMMPDRERSSIRGQASSPRSYQYQPTINDVLQVKETLLKMLPLEIIDVVVDMAEYWPHTTSINAPPDCTPIVNSYRKNDNLFVLRTPPLGFAPVTPWKNVTSTSTGTTATDVGSELGGTGIYSWDLGSFPKPPQDFDIPKGGSTLTEEVLEHWRAISATRAEFPCRKIVVTMRSRDQGWGGLYHGTYRGSSSWFDVGQERMIAYRQGVAADEKEYLSTPSKNHQYPTVCSTYTVLPTFSLKTGTDACDLPDGFEHDLNPGPMCLQKNVVADKWSKEHKIVWSVHDNIHPESPEADKLEEQGRGRESATGNFIRSLRLGDSVTIWQKARFSGWCNHLEQLTVEVYWAV